MNFKSLWYPLIRQLYKNTIKRKRGSSRKNGGDNINTSWEKLKTNIKVTASQHLGKRNTKRRNTYCRREGEMLIKRTR